MSGVCYTGRWTQLGPRRGPGARGPVQLRPTTARGELVAKVGRWAENLTDRLRPRR